MNFKGVGIFFETFSELGAKFAEKGAAPSVGA
jgi:hypothetical protein